MGRWSALLAPQYARLATGTGAADGKMGKRGPIQVALGPRPQATRAKEGPGRTPALIRAVAPSGASSSRVGLCQIPTARRENTRRANIDRLSISDDALPLVVASVARVIHQASNGRTNDRTDLLPSSARSQSPSPYAHHPSVRPPAHAAIHVARPQGTAFTPANSHV